LNGLSQALTDFGGFEVVASVTSGLGAISAARKMLPDLLVLDFAMPDANGLEVFIEATRWSPATRTAIVTGTAKHDLLRQLIDAGVHGFFMKTIAPNRLCADLTQVAAGVTVVCAATQTALDQSFGNQKLSTRELEVLQCISHGLTNAKIAERLGISPKTVDSHRTALLRKMNVNSTVSLLIHAVRTGIIDV
jgi:DNA-binding NarL/FixJ family response regulator